MATSTCVSRRARLLGGAAIGLAIVALAACDNGGSKSTSGSTAGAAGLKVLVKGGAAHGVEGLTFGPDGMIYAASSFSNSVLKIDPKTGAVATAAGPPDGESDDVAVGPANTPAAGIIVWTSPPTGRLLMKKPGGET